MSYETTPGRRYIGANVQVEWGKLSCEYDPRALAVEMSNTLALKLSRSCPEAADAIPELAQAVARRASAIFFSKLPTELEMFAGALLVKSVSAAYEETMTRSAAIGATSHEIASINGQLREHLESALIQGHRHVWGTPKIGSPQKTDTEKRAKWTEKREELIARYSAAILELIGRNEPRKRANIARIVYLTKKNGERIQKNSRQVLLVIDTKKYQLDLNSLIAEMENEEKS
jgi:hypothetical protein